MSDVYGEARCNKIPIVERLLIHKFARKGLYWNILKVAGIINFKCGDGILILNLKALDQFRYA